MGPINDLCELFQVIAANVWDEIAANNNRGNHLDERGITSQNVVGKIQDYIQQSQSALIFAQRAKYESKRGGDLELYIEVNRHRYKRIFLQAKILKPNGIYLDVDHKVKSSGKYQWELLEDFSQISGCIPYYIFYNGVTDYKYQGTDCYGEFNEKQFGCAIEDVGMVKDYCLTNNTGELPFINSQSFPIGDPWRKIPCCLNEQGDESARLYSTDEIDMDPTFHEIFRRPHLGYITDSKPPKKEVEVINEELKSKDWSPSARLVVSDSGIYPGTTELRILY